MEQMQVPKLVSQLGNVIDTDPDHLELRLLLHGFGTMEPNDHNVMWACAYHVFHLCDNFCMHFSHEFFVKGVYG